jgi:hypothetical protein
MTRYLFTTALFGALMFAQAPPAAAPPKPARVVPPARILDFKADKVAIQAGQTVTLIWATENPNSVNIMPQPGRVSPRGSVSLSPAATTVYILTVTGPNNQTETRQVTVNVTGTAPVQSATTAVTHPDLSGVYNFGGGGGAPGAGRGGAGAAPAGPQLKPGKESYRVVRGPNDPGALSDCMPIAGPAAYTVPYQFQIVQNANYVLILHEYPGVFRIVPIDSPGNRVTHPVDPDPTWMGDAVGHWEGDTLVVDIVGFNTNTELSGYKHSDALHIVEKFRKPTPDALEYEATLEDPEVFVRPWTVKRTFPLRADLKKIDEFVCENNHDYKQFFAK